MGRYCTITNILSVTCQGGYLTCQNLYAVTRHVRQLTKGSCVTYVQIWKFSVRPLVRWHIFDLVTAHFGGWQIENFARCVTVTHGWRNIHNCTVYEYIGWFQGEEAELWWGAKQLWGRRIKIALGSLLDIYSALKCVDDWPNDDQMVLRVNCITK